MARHDEWDGEVQVQSPLRLVSVIALAAGDHAHDPALALRRRLAKPVAMVAKWLSG